MELDDFRRSWQQAASSDTSAPLDSGAVARLLKQSSRSTVAEMLRNAWLEVVFTILFLAIGIYGWLQAEKLENQVMMGWWILLCVVSIGSYHRHLITRLRGIKDAGAAVHDQLTQQLQQVREVLHQSYRSSMWSLPISLGVPMGFTLVKLAQEMAVNKKMVLIFWLTVVFYVVLSYVAFLGMRWFAKHYLQQQYGQHLDRLEGLLRELEA